MWCRRVTRFTNGTHGIWQAFGTRGLFLHGIALIDNQINTSYVCYIMTKRQIDYQDLVNEIINLSPKMRFVGIIDLRGNIIEGIMKEGKTSLESQREQEHFCRQVAERRRMRREFDKTLGKVRYVHVERENVSQLVVYTPKRTIFVTLETDLKIEKKIQLVTRIKKIISNL